MAALERPVGPDGEVILAVAHLRGEDLAIDLVVDAVVVQTLGLNLRQLCAHRRLLAEAAERELVGAGPPPGMGG